MTQNPKSVTNGCKPDRKPPAEDVKFLVGSKTSVGELKGTRHILLSHTVRMYSACSCIIRGRFTSDNYVYNQAERLEYIYIYIYIYI